MRKRLLRLSVLLILSAAATFAQSDAPPKEAIDITAAQIKDVQKDEVKKNQPIVDEQIKIVDMGKYNLGLGVIHRGPTKDNDPINCVIHFQTAETYIILSGSGTLVTGGTMVNPKPSSPDSDGVKILNGPSEGGTVKDAYTRKVSVGDVIMIPPGVAHGWIGITDHVDYLSVRPDPDHVLPAGYTNPVLDRPYNYPER